MLDSTLYYGILNITEYKGIMIIVICKISRSMPNLILQIVFHCGRHTMQFYLRKKKERIRV